MCRPNPDPASNQETFPDLLIPDTLLTTTMDQPFHPLAYWRQLRRRWLLIAIPFLLALLVAVLIGLLSPVRYTATATLVAPKPQTVWRFDNNMYDVVDLRFDWRAEVMPLLMTEDLAQRALDKVGSQLEAPLDASSLLQATHTRQGSGSLFSISVTAASAHDAALLANAMAEALPEAVADYYVGTDSLYEQALADAQARFQALDEKLVAFRARTGISLGFNGEITARGNDELFGAHSEIKQELTLINSYRAARQIAIDRIDMVMQQADTGAALSLTLLDNPELQPYTSYDTLLALQTQQGDAAVLAELQRVRAAMQKDLNALQTSALAKQSATANMLKELDEILRERGVWQQTVVTLENKQAELDMKRIIEGARVKIVDSAQEPQAPSQPRWLLNLLVAGSGGLLAGLFLAVAAVYLSEDET